MPHVVQIFYDPKLETNLYLDKDGHIWRVVDVHRDYSERRLIEFELPPLATNDDIQTLRGKRSLETWRVMNTGDIKKRTKYESGGGDVQET